MCEIFYPSKSRLSQAECAEATETTYDRENSKIGNIVKTKGINPGQIFQIETGSDLNSDKVHGQTKLAEILKKNRENTCSYTLFNICRVI